MRFALLTFTCAAALLTACSPQDSSAPSATPSKSLVPLAELGSPDFKGGTTTQGWIMNTEELSSQIFTDDSQETGVLYDVQKLEERIIDGVSYVYIEASGIPKFNVVIDEHILGLLNGRPEADNGDFKGGKANLKVGDTVEFGQDIGFNSAEEFCTDTGGAGYWPPGPSCPQEQNYQSYLTTQPQPNDEECETGLGITGYWVNGSAIYNWGDGQTYNRSGMWWQLAPVAEYYDVDICLGHSALGAYHTHNYSLCVAQLVDDNSSAHSPLVGYSMDGYAVYGPWESKDTLAKSGWRLRDYGAGPSEGGCETPDERSCILVDEYDISKGVKAPDSAGPNFTTRVTSLSDNAFDTFNGFYYEDFYYAGAPVTGAQLDEHNGHNTGDGRGYHYHVTLERVAEGLLPAFPYTMGPRFYGEIPDNSDGVCATSPGPGGAGGPEGAGGMGPPPGAGMGPPPGGGMGPPPGGMGGPVVVKRENAPEYKPAALVINMK